MTGSDEAGHPVPRGTLPTAAAALTVADAAARASGAGPLTFATERLSVSYHTENGELPAVRDVSVSAAAGQAVGLVGESGSGKTTFALGAIGYLPGNGRIDRGASRLHGIDLVTMPPKEMRKLWGSKIGLVSQDPQDALNPTLTIGRQLDEMGTRHLELGKAAARRASLDMLAKVGMPDPSTTIESYPHQLSGGMLQRCCIAMALLPHPDLLVLDEPTTSLDVTTQAMILDLLEHLGDEFRLAILYITHNLGVVSRFCDRVVVMYAGEVVEEGAVSEVFSQPLHPYTANLLRCVPRLWRPAAGTPLGFGAGVPSGGHAADTAPGPQERLATLPGDLPPLGELPPGCIFAPRCPLALPSCTVARPRLMQAGAGRVSACLRWPLLVSAEGREAAVAVGPAQGVAHTVGRRFTSSGGNATRDAQPAAGRSSEDPLLVVKHAVKEFPGPRRHTIIRAVSDASLALPRKQTFGLVGESGSGKTTLARMVAGLTPPTSGTVVFDSQELRPTVSKRKRNVLRRLQMVFQNPDGSLNPRHTVRQELVRPLVRLAGLDARAAGEVAGELLRAVRLPESYLDRYPGELSGGEKQRVAIARAFAAGPDLVLCDEPVSSLDVSVQGALMNLLVDLQRERETSYLFISHDIAAVQHLSHRIGVMYMGKLVEQGDAAEVLAPPYHPYTEALLAAVLDPVAPVGPVRLRGNPPPDERGWRTGCAFHPRCPRYLGEICRTEEPPWREPDDRETPKGGAGDTGVSHAIRCHIPYEPLRVAQASAGAAAWAAAAADEEGAR